MRLLAVSSGERLEGVDAPTLSEAGYDVVVQNWRMVAAAPGLTDEQKAIEAGFAEQSGRFKDEGSVIYKQV